MSEPASGDGRRIDTPPQTAATPTTCPGVGGRQTARLVNRLKNTDLGKFHALCKMHLSFLLDLPGSRLDELLGGATGPDGGSGGGGGGAGSGERSAARIHLPHFIKRKGSKEVRGGGGGAGSTAGGAALVSDQIEQIFPLMQFLGRPENLREEGLFRKSGHMGRQRALRECLAAGGRLGAELVRGVYSAHDCAGLLKGLLGEMREPLLTERHYCAHCQVPDMPSEEKQLQTIQLLLQLVPRDKHVALQRLLSLLHQVALEQTNKMTALTLGTLFAPHILVPRKMAASELQAVTSNITRAVSFMITMAPRLFEVPEPLVRDIAKYWQEMEEHMDSVSLGSTSSENDLDICINGKLRKRPDASSCDPLINTTVTFADRPASRRAAAQTDTQVALAQLYAHVSAMPESGRKRKLLKQFNKVNGTPSGEQMSYEPKHKRSRSLSESIKKMVGRGGHKRRGSGCVLGLVSPALTTPRAALTPSPRPLASSGGSSGHNCQHTPLIRQPLRPSTPTSGAGHETPVMRLFKADLHHQALLLPSSPRVHIVDMAGDAVGLSRRVPRRPAVAAATPQLTAFRCRGGARPCCPMPPGEREGDENAPCPPPLSDAFLSPITRSVKKMPHSLLASVLITPGSRMPMAVIQTP